MRNLIMVLAVSFIGFYASNSWAQMTEEQRRMLEKHRQELEEQQAKMKTNIPAIRGPSGRYQGIKLNDNKIVILDTTEGKLWLWDAKTNTILYKNEIQ